MEGLDLFEAVAVDDAVDEKKAFARAHVLLAHGRVLFLPSSIKNVQQRHLVVNQTLFAVRVFNRRVVLVLEGEGWKGARRRGEARSEGK